MKDKKVLIIGIGLLIIILGMGVTLAFYSNSKSYTLNSARAATFDVTYNHTFQAPSTFFPGDDATPTITVTNNGTTPLIIRASITESWTKNGSPISTTLSNNEDSVIKYINDNWYKIGNYYYYKEVLNNNVTTPSLIDSILFNNNTPIEEVCENSNCTPTTIYTGATYKIEVNFEAIQSNVYESEWNVSLSDKTLLNDIIKKSTYDDIEDIDYSSVSSITNGNGIYMLSSTISNSNPIYFYRGNNLNNNVVIDGYCFYIVNTNSSGNINMIYNGEYVNNSCNNDYIVNSNINRSDISTYSNSFISTLNKSYVSGSYLLTLDDLSKVGVVTGTSSNTYLNGNNEYFIDNGYVLGTTLSSSDVGGLRPVIVIDNNTTFVSGNGSSGNPYILN